MHSGLCVEGGTDTHVRNNVVRENVVEGIVVSDATRIAITGNRVSRNNLGVLITDDASGTVEHNVITRSLQVGIGLGFSAGTTIRSNTIRSGFGFGVIIVQSGDVELAVNSVQDVVLGVGVNQCVGCTLSRNSVAFNNTAAEPVGGGIVLRGLDASTIVQNAARRNGVVDCAWDATGANVFVRNACGVEVPPGAWD